MTPDPTLSCPYCDGKAILLDYLDSYYYQCMVCSEEFTTTESDELSLKNLKK